MLKLTLTVRD